MVETRPQPSRWPILAGLVLLLTIVGLGVTFMVDERAERLARAEPPELALGDYVILPGRESAVHELLAPVADGALPGIEQYSFTIQKSSIRVDLHGADSQALAGCPGTLELSRAPPDAAALEPPGSGSVRHESLWLRWHWCDGQANEARDAAVHALARALGEHDNLDAIWQAPAAPPAPFVPPQSGLLRPAVEWTGLDHERLTIVVLIGGVLLSGLVALGVGPELPGPTPLRAQAPRWTWAAVVLLLLIAAWLRVDLGADRALDSDESWAGPLGGSIFGETHDPWVHPPLFHLIQQPWIRAIGWQPGDDLLRLRAPMIGFGLLATAVAVAAVTVRAHTPWIALLALPCAVAPQLASTLVLARPYALAAALVVICAAACWPAGEAESPWVARARWWLILMAAGLAAWTDVIAGAAAGLMIMARLLAGPRRNGIAVAGVVIVLAAWVMPLVPGSLEALTHHVDPEVSQATLDALGIARPGDVRPDPDLTGRLPAFCVFGLDRTLWPVGVLGLAAAALLAWIGWRRRSFALEAALPLFCIALWLLVASQLVHLRARNVAFAPELTALLAAVVLGSRRRSPDPRPR